MAKESAKRDRPIAPNLLARNFEPEAPSRKADCWDNAVSESFFATLRAELVDDERSPTRGAAEAR